MTAQTSYAIKQGSYYEGQIVNLAPMDIVSRAVETAAGIGMGRVVSRGTGEDQVVLGGDNAFFGVTVRDVDRESQPITDDLIYGVTQTAGVMRYGYIAVRIPTGGVPGAALKYNDTTGIVDTGAVGAGETLIVGATLETTTAATGLGVIRLTQ